MPKASPADFAIVKVGLAQIPTDGLRRLDRWIKAKKPLITNGSDLVHNNGMG